MEKRLRYIIILHMCTINDSCMKYGLYEVWDMECNRHNFFVILDHFFALLPPNNPKNQNFEKNEKNLRDIIILNMCTINDNHMMYGSWDTEHNRQNFC